MSKLKNIVAAIILLVTINSTTKAQAKQVNFAETSEQLSVKYLGSDADYLLFELNIQSKNSGKSFFELSDKEEGMLYSANVKNGATVKTLKVEKRDHQMLDFKLINGNKIYYKSFSVNSNIEEKIVVAESDVTKL